MSTKRNESSVESVWARRISHTHCYSRNYLREKEVDRRLLKFIIKPKAKILDVGCFYPHEAIRLARLGCLVTAIDIVNQVVKQARKAVKKAGVETRVKIEHGDATNLKYKDHSFDVIIDLTTSVLIPNWPQAIREYRRVLKPNGQLVIVTNNKLQPFAWLELLKQAINHGIHRRWGYFTPSFPWELKRELEKNNFKVLKFDAEKLWVPVLPKALDKHLESILSIVARKFSSLKYLGWRYGFLCQKIA